MNLFAERNSRIDTENAFKALCEDNKKSFLWRTDTDDSELEFSNELQRINLISKPNSTDINRIKKCFLNEYIYSTITDYPEYNNHMTAKGGLWFA